MTQLMRDDTVVLFPGQGSISEGVGAPWQNSPHWSIVSRVSEVSDIDVAELLLNSPTSELVRTDRAQIATFTLSLVGYYDMRDTGLNPRYLLGHSLGEFSALVASGLLSIEDGARVIAARGSAMAQAATVVDGSMVAVMGGELEARHALENLPDVWVANINGSGQIVLSGTVEGLSYVLENHRELGWKRATPLPVGGAFHSPLMAPAQNQLDAVLESVAWERTDHILIANVDGKAHTDADEWRQLLSRQLTSPVEFLAATQALPASVTHSIEMPPGNVLTGLTRRIREFEAQWCPGSYQEMKELAQ
jgi:[acyl-carrier-protein] S-malonyltransferase